jgi:hypothetical protein
MMETASNSEKFLNFYRTTLCDFPQGSHLGTGQILIAIVNAFNEVCASRTKTVVS